jgi:hypothetical protein
MGARVDSFEIGYVSSLLLQMGFLLPSRTNRFENTKPRAETLA